MMVTISTEQKVIDILNAFVGEKHEQAIEKFYALSEDDLHFVIKFEKYKGCLNAPAAKVIIEFQNSIYKIAALLVKGKADIRLLTDDQKERLEIPFKISESSTIEEAVELLKRIKELLSMIPEKHRAFALTAALIIVFGYLSWDRHLDYKEKTEVPRVLETALEKISEQNLVLSEIIAGHEKGMLKNLSEIDQNIEFQERSYSAEEIETIKRDKYPRKIVKNVSNIKGVFTIIDINIKDNYLIVEESTNSDPLKIYYDSENLIAEMLDIKKHLKEAIDNEHKRFYIEAVSIKKNNKVDTRALSKITEYKQVSSND